MKRFATVVAISASFFLAGAVSASAQDDHKDKERKEVRKEERHEEREERHAEERHVAHEEHVAHAERRAEIRRISDAHFHEHFGREHYFAVQHVTIVAGHPRFLYGGYRFEIGQPWPARWAYADSCYIDFVDGQYFLFNVRHPGVRIAVNVVP
jgi:Ni/Co efflux regulator RcnB